jgi:hypothetical protein
MTRDLLQEPARGGDEPDAPARIFINGPGSWGCPHCSFIRTYGTYEGAVSGAAAHLLERHRIRLKIAPRHHGGMVGGGR